MQCRDWIADLDPASFRGVPFYVERHQVKSGRRLVVHEFPLRDDPYIEDLGRQANAITVTAYVASETADADADALLAACDEGGPGQLVLPLLRLRAHCDEASRDFSKDRLGFVAFSIKFWREGTATAQTPAGASARLAEWTADSFAAAMEPAFLAAYQGQGVAGLVLDASAARIAAIAGAIDQIRLGLAMDAASAADLGAAVASLVADALVLARAVPGDAPVVTAIVEAVRLARFGADGGLVRPYLAGLVAADFGATSPRTPVRRLAGSNEAALDTLLIAAAAAQYAVAVTEIALADRRQAIQLRADVVETVEVALARLDGAAAAPARLQLILIRDQTLAYLSRAIADLAPVVVATAHRSLPSLWWSNRLYGTADRAGELAARNRVVHAGFMPLDVEALAS